jgi:hypothetical protein
VSDKLLRLTRDQCQKLFDQGFCYVEISKGHTARVTIDDVCFKKEELDALIEKENGKKMNDYKE